jgi:hypothetical protein
MSLYHFPSGVAVLARLGFIVLGLLAGCDDVQQPTAPATTETPAPSSALRALHPADAIEFSDVVERVLPSFSDQVIAAELGARLEQFSAAYSSGDDALARRALNRAQVLLMKSSAHSANLSAVRLALGQAQTLLDSAHASDLP